MSLFDHHQPEEELGTLDLASRLNPSQLAAATYQGGPLLIVAGAGSGKTRTLVHRVAYLVDQGVPPPAILLLTFTRKAAQEMLGRVTALVGRRASRVGGGTFHSLANQLLRSHAHHLGYPPDFAIMDQDDAESLLGRIRSELPEIKKFKRFPQRGALLNILSQSINKDRPILETMADSFPHFIEFAPLVVKIGESYRDYKVQNALMDFDDLLVGLETVMREHEDVRVRLASRYEHILVDEYQDTNPIQARLTHLLGRDHLRVTAVGDDAQSIYAFRGASFRNIMDFPKKFPDTKVLKLVENYRSQSPIVELANHLISQAAEKYDKKLVAVRGAGPEPQVVAVQDQMDEAGWVAAHIEKLMGSAELKDMAVLFRASSHSFDLEVELVRRRIPFTKFGGRKFLESAHIKDFMAYLRVAANPADGISLRRILGLVEGIGHKGASDIATWVGGNRERLGSLNGSPAKGKAKINLEPLGQLLADIVEADIDMAFRVETVASYYLPLMADIYPDDWPDRRGDITELLRMAESRDNLRSFLDELTLDPPNQKKSGGEEVNQGLTLSTIHSAKGLEWKNVVILSAVEGRFPPVYAIRSAADVEEERRLMYVAITRAEDSLIIMMPLGIYDHRTGMSAAPSRFLADLAPPSSGSRWGNNYGTPQDVVLKVVNEKPLGYNHSIKRSCETDPGLSGAVLGGGTTVLEPSEITEGIKISHPIYGPGTVVEVNGPQVIIDFDLFGRKKVMVQYARLTAR